jgi:hypothetical protein
MCVSLGWAGQQLVQPDDAHEPAFLEFREQLVGAAHGVRVASHALRAAVSSFGDQLGSFEHGHVLLHGGERHVVVRRQLGDGRVGIHYPGQDVAPCSVGERPEQLIEDTRRRLTYNHMVVYITRRAGCHAPRA